MILVTGTSGLLGAALQKELGARGGPCLCPTRQDVDLMDTDAVLAYFDQHRPRLVYHAAARVHGLMGNRRFPAEIFDENVRINFNVISAGHRTGVEKFIVASTVAAYPGHLNANINEDQYLDGPPHDGESSYAHSKRAMLAQLDAYRRQYDTSYAYAIFTNLYGPGDRFDTENGHVVPSLVAKFHAAKRDGTPVHVWGKGRARRDFLYAGDGAAAMLHLTDEAQGPVNIASGTTVPIARVVEILSEISGVTDIIWQEDKPEGQLDRSYDVTRLRDLGFTHRHSLEDGLKLTFDWYSAHYPNLRV